MNPDIMHIRHCMLYEYHQHKNAVKATESILSVYPGCGLDKRVCQNWFSRFKNGDFDLNDKPRSGRPVQADDDILEQLLEEDPKQSTRELALKLAVCQKTVCNRLHALGKVQKVGKWVPHKLSEINAANRLSTCVSLLTRHKTKSFLWRIVTGDEKWIYYDNPVSRKQWLGPSEEPLHVPKPEIHRKKTMLCVWWDQQGIIYYELLEPRETVNASLYSQQLVRMSQVLARKRPAVGVKKRKVILLHDNARPHVAKTTKETIETLGWEVLSHPAYSPDIAPSDYHLFRSMQHFLQEKNYLDFEGVRKDVDLFFASKPASFYHRGIQSLPERWAKVVDNDGYYFND